MFSVGYGKDRKSVQKIVVIAVESQTPSHSLKPLLNLSSEQCTASSFGKLESRNPHQLKWQHHHHHSKLQLKILSKDP